MAESKTSERRIRAWERARQALELRRAGVHYDEIARQLGYRTASGAYEAIRSAMRRTLQEPADELRKLECERLDAALAAIWPLVQQGDLAAIDRMLRISQRRSELLGLDAPRAVSATIEMQLADELQAILATLTASAGGDDAGSDGQP